MELWPWEVHCVTVGVHQGLLSLSCSFPKQRTLYRPQYRPQTVNLAAFWGCLWAGLVSQVSQRLCQAGPGSSPASNPKLPGRGRTEANLWAIGALPVAAAGGTDGDIWNTRASAQGLELTPSPCFHSRHSSMLWMEGSPSGIPAILLAFSQPHQRTLGSIIIYNLEQYQLNGVRPCIQTAQLLGAGTWPKKSQFKISRGENLASQGEAVDVPREFFPGTQAHGCAQGIYPSTHLMLPVSLTRPIPHGGARAGTWAVKPKGG